MLDIFTAGAKELKPSFIIFENTKTRSIKQKY